MMARQLAKTLGQVDRIETAIHLSLGDEYGPDSMHHVLDAVTQPYSVLEDGARHPAVPFSRGQRVVFPAPIGPRTAYLFPWSDVVYYPKTLGARTSLGWKPTFEEVTPSVLPEAAADSSSPAVVLCDRGAVNGAAYSFAVVLP